MHLLCPFEFWSYCVLIENAVMCQTCEYLALACINLCRVVDPEVTAGAFDTVHFSLLHSPSSPNCCCCCLALQVIFLAGGMAQAGSVLIERVQYYIARYGWTVLPNQVSFPLHACNACVSTGVLIDASFVVIRLTCA